MSNSTAPPMPADERLDAMNAFVAAFTGLRALVESDLERSNLTGSEFEVLVRLSRAPGHRMQMSALARQTIVSSSGLTRLVDRLSADGLMQRVKDQDDRRIAYAELTADGLRRVDDALPGHLDILDRCLLGPLEDHELATLIDAMRKIRSATRRHADAPAVAVD